MKNNLYRQVIKARKEDEDNWTKIEKIVTTKERELEEATKLIERKYQATLRFLEKKATIDRKNFLKIAELHNRYSSFNVSDITVTISLLLTHIEGEMFIPFENLEVGSNSIIIKEKVTNKYDKLDFETLYKNGDLVILDNKYSNKIEFYNNAGEANYSFGDFSYLYEFVNQLIQYRYNNDKKDNMTIEELYTFMENFLVNNPKLSQRNAEKRREMLLSQQRKDKESSTSKVFEKK